MPSEVIRTFEMTAAAKCSSAANKYHAAKELELVRKNSICSFYNYVNKKLCSPPVIPDIRQPDGSLCTGDLDKNALCLIIFWQCIY